MPHPVTIINQAKIIITTWDTGNITIETSSPVQLSELNTLIQQDTKNAIEFTEHFIQKINDQIKGILESFFFLANDKPDFWLSVSSDNITLKISADEMLAKIAIAPNTSFQKVFNFLQANNIVHGINISLMKEKMAQNYTDFFEIAKGTSPKKAIAEKINEYFYNTKRYPPLAIKQKQRITYLDLSFQNRVSKNSYIASINDEVQGENGKTITGHIIPVQKFFAGEVHLGFNVYRKKNNIYSSIDGIVTFDDKLISVLPTLIRRQAVNSKNITFAGTVIIENDLINSTIYAENDVIVFGSIKNCTIVCNGFLYSMSGILGSRSKINANFNIFCVYTKNATITSKYGNISIATEAFHANLTARGAVTVERKIIGGKTHSNKYIKTSEVGSKKSRIITKLTLEPTSKFYNKIEHCTQKILELNKKLNTIQIEKNKIIKLSQPYEKKIKEKHTSLCKVEKILHKDILHYKNLITCLQSDYKNLEDAFILIYNYAWRGTEIVIGKDRLEVTDKPYASFFYKGSFGIARKRY